MAILDPRQIAVILKSMDIVENELPAERLMRAGAKLSKMIKDGQSVHFEERPQAEIPPLFIRGLNFAAALVRWTTAGMPRRTESEIEERLAICQACPHLVDHHCNLCGCACVETDQLMNKLALATEACPLGKWK